ncbi:MAG: hypothetical protein ACI9XC_001013 [Gammaproteobacteria bacterium]|jgi:hypothetical protein
MSERDHKIKHYPALAHGEITSIFDGIWFVKGAVKMPMILPMKISRSMTIVKDSDSNDLTIFNSMRLNDKGLEELEKLGTIKNVVRLSGFHGRDDGFYRERYDAKIYAIKGQAYTRKLSEKVSENDIYMEPDVWLSDDNNQLPIKDSSLKIFKSSQPSEAIAIINREGGILITGDSLQNTAKPDKYANLFAKIMMKKMGFYEPYNVGPGWLKFAKPEINEVRSILELEFSHVLPAHGDPVLGDAREKFRSVIEGDLKGCHTK